MQEERKISSFLPLLSTLEIKAIFMKKLGAEIAQSL
jgi:hypothetical protein